MKFLMTWASFFPSVSFSLVITVILYFFTSTFNRRVTYTRHDLSHPSRSDSGHRSHSSPLPLVLGRRWQRQEVLPLQHPWEPLPQTRAWEAHLESPGQRCRKEAYQGGARQVKPRHHGDLRRVDLLRSSTHCVTPPVAGSLSIFKGSMELGRRDGRRPT